MKKFSSFAEAEQLDNEYYASLSEVERLEILIGLRAMIVPKFDRIEKLVFIKTINGPDIEKLEARNKNK